jgi:signal transduction histidine kinase/CheY-like chemotaxis protein
MRATAIFAFLTRDADETAVSSEETQASVRVAVAVCALVYVGVRLWLPSAASSGDQGQLLLIGAYIMAFGLVSALLLAHIRRNPGHRPIRRLSAMVLDYGSLAFTISMGGEAMLPLFAVIIWATVGNGLRYGSRYLMVATVMALVTIAVITWATPYWRDHPDLVLTFTLTVLIVPTYALILLRSAHRSRRAALEATMAKSRFLAQASHDLRQPVHAIGLFLASLRQTGLDGNQRIIVERIDRALQSVAGLFRSLLDISTLDSGTVSPKLEAMPLQQLFRELALQNGDGAAWSDSELHFATTRVVAVADRALLLTMVQNLISNALKYAPGQPVLVGCRRRNGTISIAVYDRGPGIDPEHLPFLCEEFYRVRPVGGADTQGVGLGLSIVDRMAGIMGLTLRITSRLGRGTMVAIDGIPIAPPVESHAARVTKAQQTLPQTPLAGLRVLLIEDDVDVLEAMRALLQSWGCVVTASIHLPREEWACDMVIADFDIGGGVTGADCINLVRMTAQRTRQANIAAIVMTGHDETHVRAVLGDTSIPILKKPIRPAEIRSVMTAMRRQMADPGLDQDNARGPASAPG